MRWAILPDLVPEGAAMNLRRRVGSFAIVVATLAVAVAATARVAPAQQRFEWPEKAKNLKVLPKNTPKEKLSATMIGFTRALGVRCPFCHVGQDRQHGGTVQHPPRSLLQQRLVRFQRTKPQ